MLKYSFLWLKIKLVMVSYYRNACSHSGGGTGIEGSAIAPPNFAMNVIFKSKTYNNCIFSKKTMLRLVSGFLLLRTSWAGFELNWTELNFSKVVCLHFRMAPYNNCIFSKKTMLRLVSGFLLLWTSWAESELNWTEFF